MADSLIQRVYILYLKCLLLGAVALLIGSLVLEFDVEATQGPKVSLICLCRRPFESRFWPSMNSPASFSCY